MSDDPDDADDADKILIHCHRCDEEYEITEPTTYIRCPICGARTDIDPI